MRLSFFLFIAILLSSCAKKEVYHQLTFDKEIMLSGEEVFTDVHNIIYLYTIDSLLLTMNYTTDTGNLFSIYNSNNLELIGGFGKNGEGPNEFENCLYYCNSDCSDKNNLKFWIYSCNKKQYDCINVSRSIDSARTIIDETINVSPSVNFCISAYFNDECVIGDVSNQDLNRSALRFYNPKTSEVYRDIPLYPEIENSNKDMYFIMYTYNNYYMSFVRRNPIQNKFAYGMAYFNRIDIYDTSGVIEHSIVEGNESPVKNMQDNIIDIGDEEYRFKSPKYYIGLSVSEKYIYALYSGHTYSELEADKPLGREIRIFSWEGDALAKIHVSESLRQFTFTVDEKNGYVYAIRQDEEKVMRYDIKELLDEL